MSHNNQTEHPQNFETSPHRQVEIRMGNTLLPIGVICDDPAIIAESQTQQTLIQQTNDPIPPSDGPPEELEEREVETQHITAKQQRFSYSKKLLRAPHSFWLNPSSYESFKQKFPICKEQPIYLYGKIIECPNLRNNKQFIISWNLCHSNFSDESVLWSFSLSLDTKNKLQQYIQDFLDSKQPPQPPIPVINKDNSNNVDPANSCPIDQNDSAAHPLTHSPTYKKMRVLLPNPTVVMILHHKIRNNANVVEFCDKRLRCPIRQYNQNKPQKFRVDFFVMAASQSYAILNIDVYHGGNSQNIGVAPEAVNLPMMMKAVINACVNLRLHVRPDGYRHISADNRYMCPQLYMLLKTKYHSYSSSTCRQNRIGWDKDMLNLKKTKNNRGKMKIVHDADNGLICGQWVDSKVVNFVSSIEDCGYGIIERQVGSVKETFKCPRVLMRYQKNMGAIDRGNQMRLHGGGFATHSHFKKWYKKTYLAIMDCMLLNSYIAWNMSCKERHGKAIRRRELSRSEFITIVAQQMVTYRDPDNGNNETTEISSSTIHETTTQRNSGHCPIPSSGKTKMCVVCSLWWRWQTKKFGCKGMYSHLAKWAKCGVLCHFAVVKDQMGRNGWKIHGLPEFKGLTCFEILHSPTGREIWKIESASGKRFGYSTVCSHRLVLKLREMHGIGKYTRKRKKKGNDNDESENADNESYSSDDDSSSRFPSDNNKQNCESESSGSDSVIAEIDFDYESNSDSDNAEQNNTVAENDENDNDHTKNNSNNEKAKDSSDEEEDIYS